MAVINYEQKTEMKPTPFEIALAETEFGRLNYFIIIVCGIIIVNTVSEVIGISYILPIAECDLNFSLQQKSVLSGISFVGIICSSHLWGFLADTLGRRRIMIPSLTIAFTITILSSFSNSFLMLVLLRFLNGIFICGGSATAFTYLSEFHVSQKRNKAIMAASFISAMTAISFPFVAWLIINQDWKIPIKFLGIVYRPWRLYLMSGGIYGIVGVFCLLNCYESPKFLLCIGENEKSLNVLKRIFVINTRKMPEDYSVKQLEAENSKIANELRARKESFKSFLLISKLVWQQTAPLFSRKLLRSTSLLCFIQFCTLMSAHGLRMWMPEIINSVQIYLSREKATVDATICHIVKSEKNIMKMKQYQTNETECVTKLEFGTIKYSAIFEAVYPIAFLLIAIGMKIAGRVKITFFILTICGTCGILSAIIRIPIVGIILYLIQLLVGIGVTVINSLSVEMFPTHLKTMAVSLVLMFGRLGSVFGSNASGMLIENYCESAFIGSGVCLIISAFLAFLLPKPEKPTTQALNVSPIGEANDEDIIFMTKL